MTKLDEGGTAIWHDQSSRIQWPPEALRYRMQRHPLRMRRPRWRWTVRVATRASSSRSPTCQIAVPPKSSFVITFDSSITLRAIRASFKYFQPNMANFNQIFKYLTTVYSASCATNFHVLGSSNLRKRC